MNLSLPKPAMGVHWMQIKWEEAWERQSSLFILLKLYPVLVQFTSGKYYEFLFSLDSICFIPVILPTESCAQSKRALGTGEWEVCFNRETDGFLKQPRQEPGKHLETDNNVGKNEPRAALLGTGWEAELAAMRRLTLSSTFSGTP